MDYDVALRLENVITIKMSKVISHITVKRRGGISKFNVTSPSTPVPILLH